MESIINHELCNINTWLCSNKLLLNIEKTSFVIFKPHQKKINYSMELTINDKSIKHVRSVKYLGIMLDCHLNWEDHIASICKKLSRSRYRCFMQSPSLCNNENSNPIILFYYLSFSYIWLYSVGYDIQYKYPASISPAEEDYSYYDIF